MKNPFATDNLKSEKLTFIVLICIMLFSLIYMSSYSVLMQDKIDHFQQDLASISREMAILQEFLPEKDSVIQNQKQRIIKQVQAIEIEIRKNKLSEGERGKLVNRLSELKDQIVELKTKAKERLSVTLVAEQYEAKPILHQVVIKNDTLLQEKEKEISRLKAIINELESKKPSVILKDKLAMYYFTVVSSDKKNRASRTKALKFQFQLKGDSDKLTDKYLYIEVRDPSHKVISGQNDKVRIANHYISNYTFEPDQYEFIKGKYSVKIFSKEAEFQTVTFLTLT